MANPNIQLGSLDFDGIKSSITEYLKTQDKLKDYDYTGSVMQVLVDVLSYNTLYYGFYSNMLANEMFLDTSQREESLISLVKPLGYVVPGKSSAKAKAKLRQGGNNTDVPRYTRFTGNNASGVSYNFYTIDNYILDGQGEAVIPIVEGKSLTLEQPLLIDNSTQKGFLRGLDVDISTVRVEVYNSDPNPLPEETQRWELWSRSGNVEQGLSDESKVYWLERTELGFFVVFGGNYADTTGLQIGRSVPENTQVRVSYLKSSGESGNGVGNWNVSSSEISATTETVSLSTGGTDKPDMEAIRFFAPKWFAAQDRAVTVDDARALLAKQGFISDSTDPYAKINVWGGEEMDPPRYGRVFVSLDTSIEEDPGNAAIAVAVLEQKTSVSILPEYIDPEKIVVEVRGNLIYEPLSTNLTEDQLLSLAIGNISTKYTSGFNKTYDTKDISSLVNGLNDAFHVNSEDLSFRIRKDVSIQSNGRPKNIRLKNKCKPGSLITNTFSASAGSFYYDNIENSDKKMFLQTLSETTNRRGGQKIEAYYFWNSLRVNLGPVGQFYPKTGEIVFSAAFTDDGFRLFVEPLLDGTETIFSKEELYSVIAADVQMVRRGIG